MYFFLLKMEKVGGELGVCGRVWECGKPNGFSIISMPWSEGESKTFLHFGEHFMKKGPRLIFRRRVSAGAGYYPPCYSLLRGA